jgi:uncharacterized membrane protein YfhO
MTEQGPDLKRLWQWGMHEDNLFRQRLAFTVLAESILIAAVVQLIRIENEHMIVIPVLALLIEFVGLGFTVFILYGQVRLGAHIRAITDMIGEIEGENGTYKTIRRKIPKNKHLRIIETYWPSCMFLALWIIFLSVTVWSTIAYQTMAQRP